MKKTKMMIMSAVMALSFGAFAIPTLAATYNTSAEAVAGLIGKSVADVISEIQQTGKSYGEIAVDAGKLEEFKSEVLDIKKDRLQDRVDSGQISQEQADQTVQRVAEKQANCDGTGNRDGSCGGIGTGLGQGSQNNQGQGNSTEIGRGQGNGAGTGSGRGGGKGLRDGSCIN